MQIVSQKQVALHFLQLAAAGEASKAFELYVGESFIHHNAYFKGDATTLMNAMDENARQMPNKIFEVQRALEEGDLVAVHSHVRMKPEEPGYAVMHIFRFEEGKIKELWDFGQAVPEEMVNENGMF